MSALLGVEGDIASTNSHSQKNCQNLLTEKLRIWSSNSAQPLGDKDNNKRSSNNNSNESMVEALKFSRTREPSDRDGAGGKDDLSLQKSVIPSTPSKLTQIVHKKGKEALSQDRNDNGIQDGDVGCEKPTSDFYEKNRDVIIDNELTELLSYQWENVACEICERLDEEDKMLICLRCYKGFHTDCLGLDDFAIDDGDFWRCAKCVEDVERVDATSCSICAGTTDDESMLLCDNCERGFHMYCLTPIVAVVPSGDWFCGDCKQKKEVKEFPLIQRKLNAFFKIDSSLQTWKQDRRHPTRRRQQGLIRSNWKVRNSTQLQLFRPVLCGKVRQKLMQSLATALQYYDAEYITELKYNKVPREHNDPGKQEGGIQELSKANCSILDQHHRLLKMGYWPPLSVVKDDIEGFVVEAASNIRDMTLICEYVGEVLFTSMIYRDSSDSLMDLLDTGCLDTSLTVNASKEAGVARFISGINNNDPAARKRLNCKALRYNVRGEVKALLIAIRDIRKGERLYYDYNAFRTNYPTDMFV